MIAVRAAVLVTGQVLTWTVDTECQPSDGLLENEEPLTDEALAALLASIGIT